ncbi:MAG: hypothetical protein V7724_09050 [Sediminicola sp.]
MKKVLLVAALSLGSLSAFAQQTETTATEVTEVTTTQEEFTEISAEEVPNAVKEALGSAHAGAALNKASVSEEGIYKLEVTKEDGTAVTVYTDAEGNFIDKQ